MLHFHAIVGRCNPRRAGDIETLEHVNSAIIRHLYDIMYTLGMSIVCGALIASAVVVGVGYGVADHEGE